jgi:hypothetical protein
MPRLLHILVTANDPLPAELVERQKADPSNTVVVVDLRQVPPAYDELLEEIFGADSIAAW